MLKRFQLPVLCLLLLVCPIAARADAGTPLLWAGMLHLVFLNFGIGILEGWLLAKVFHLPNLRTDAALVPANYFSMIVGWFMLRAAWTPLEHLLPGQTLLFKGASLLILLTFGSWLLSVLLEWPFCAWALRGGTPLIPGRTLWQSSLRASLLAQTASYALLVPFYLLVSPVSLYTTAHLQHSLGFVRSPLATVYYINPDDGAVWRIRTDGTGRRKVLEAHLRDHDTRLYVRPKAQRDKIGSSDVCDLGVVERSEDKTNRLSHRVLIPNVGEGCASSSNAAQGGQEADTWMNFGRPADLRQKERRDWTVFLGFWASEGVMVMHEGGSDPWSHREYRLAFETPFEQWYCRNATVLPSQQVVFQLGLDKANAQIVVLDMSRRQLGFLTRGQGPVVVLEPK